MADRTKLFSFAFSTFFVISTAVPSFAQQVNLQTSFLSAATSQLAEGAKAVSENLQRSARAEALIQKAQQRFQRGKKLYQAKDVERARKEFDAAIDLMLEGSDSPADRALFDKRLYDMVEAIHRYDLAGLGSAVNIENAEFEKAPLEDILEMTFPVDPSLKNKVKEEVLATVSQLPLSVNDAVLGYIHYFAGSGRKTLIAGLQRAGRYRPLIQRILDEEGLPQELIHLAQAESGFLPRAVSRKAATGMWQFVAWRGQQYGLKQTPYADDRLDPERATRAAARHLRDLYNKFGDWYLAVAAYNCGPNAVERAVERTGYADFWELRGRRVIPAETTNYVPIILAMTIMAKNAAEYGLTDIVADAPLEYDTVAMTSTTHLALIADLTDAPIPELLALNPALLKGVAPQGYDLRVPKGTANTLIATLQLIPAESRLSWRMHKVETGETLAEIGKRYRTAPNSIAAANRLETDSPVAGDRLLIPASFEVERAAFRGITARRSSKSSHVAVRGASAKRVPVKTSSASRRTRRKPVILTHRASIKTAANGL